MKYTYAISGMTCNGCVASVKEKLSNVSGVTGVSIDLDSGEAHIETESTIGIKTLQSALPEKYIISEQAYQKQNTSALAEDEKSKLQQLKPLLLIFAYLFAAALLLNYRDWSINSAMLDFMGLFYIVFSFFKLLDLKGFPDSFRMYDPLAKLVPAYAWVYPFIELALGLFFLMRIQIPLALAVTIIILGITTVGVTKSLLDRKSIRCACLGTALKLPMTEATFIENAIMLAMAFAMLFQMV
ncbi:MAG: heavy metal-associated domain-containing protein, partial [Maribacter sp.]